MTVPFIDLTRQNQGYKEELLAAIEKTIDAGDFVLGSALKQFEDKFAREMKGGHAVGVNSGFDALYLTLHALGIQPGDEIILPVFGPVSTAAALPRVGALPVFIDVTEDYLIDPEMVRAAVTEKTRAVVAMHTFGRAADVAALAGICTELGIHLIEDVSHACGGRAGGKALGTHGIAGIFSFYPTRGLGGLGDGGVVLTANEELANRLRLYRNYGRDTDGRSIDLGFNSRLDSLQAAALDVKLEGLDEENADRIANASFYSAQLNGEVFTVPAPLEDEAHVYNMYTIRHPQREQVRNFLRERAVETKVYYERPLHLEPCFQYLGYQEGHFPVAEQFSREVFSLPVGPGLTRKELDEVAHALGLFAQTYPAPAV